MISKHWSQRNTRITWKKRWKIYLDWPYTCTYMHICPNIQYATKLFTCLGVLNCAFNIYFDLMVKILEVFWRIIPHLSYMINKESRESIENFLRYNYFLPQVSFKQFCCWQLMSEKCENWRLLLRCWLMSHD